MAELVIGLNHPGEPLEHFLLPASAPQLVYKGIGMYCPVCGMIHIKNPLLLIKKSSLCSGGRLKRVAHSVVAAGFLFCYPS